MAWRSTEGEGLALRGGTLDLQAMIVSAPFPDRFLIMPNSEYLFGRPSDGPPLGVVAEFTYGDVADVCLTRIGAIGFRFRPEGALASFDRLDFRGTGLIPEMVTMNRDALLELQTGRLAFANFVAAALFGRAMACRHSALNGAGFSGLDRIVLFARVGDELRPEASRFTEAVLGGKLRLAGGASQGFQVLTREELQDAVAFLLHLQAREGEFQYADLRSCVAMNYQAAILHGEQHAPASLGLNFAVAEALIKELFHAYGIAPGSVRQPFATRSHGVAPLSGNAFRRRSTADLMSDLRDGGLLDAYLHQRLEEARTLRNELMHQARPVTLPQSGSAQTAVRDLWALLIEGPFELNAGYSWRI